MKHVKHMLVAALTVFLAAVLAVPAFAADATHKIKINSGDTHTYQVYQVLTGTLSEDAPQALGNPAWGSSAIANPGDVDDFITDITADGLSEAEIAAKVAAKVDASKPITVDGKSQFTGGDEITGLAVGYYALIDVTDLTSADSTHKLETKSINVVKVVNDVDGWEKKWSSTSDDKVITGDTLGANGNTFNPGKDADNVSVGDTVNYQITAKIPAKSSDYNYFYFIINDTLSDGLTLDPDSIVVYKGSVADNNKLTVNTDYVLKTGNDADPYSFQVGLKDAKGLANKQDTDIIVTYSAELNKDAVIGELGNPNTSTVTFSNDPNHTYDGTNYPGFPADKEKDVLGETPVTETKTYTTGIEIQKVDENGNVLTGATFKISGASAKKVLTVAETFTEDAAGNYYKLKNGTYTKEAPSNKDTMVLTPGATEGYVIDSNYTGADKVEIDGVVYRPYAPATDEGKDVYVLEHNNNSLYDDPSKLYKKSTTKTITDATTSHAAEKAVDANGLVRFDGLGAGTYTIAETVTPAGYNTLPDLTVTVSFNADGQKVWSFDGGSGAYDSDEGIYKITIENQKGSTLPETGGMGTTILYTVGGIMVIAGIVMFLTKRRMASIEK